MQPCAVVNGCNDRDHDLEWSARKPRSEKPREDGGQGSSSSRGRNNGDRSAREDVRVPRDEEPVQVNSGSSRRQRSREATKRRYVDPDSKEEAPAEPLAGTVCRQNGRERMTTNTLLAMGAMAKSKASC